MSDNQELVTISVYRNGLLFDLFASSVGFFVMCKKKNKIKLGVGGSCFYVNLEEILDVNLDRMEILIAI